MWERRHDRETARIMTAAGLTIPANPYPTPSERLGDNPWYRGRHPLRDRPPHLDMKRDE